MWRRIESGNCFIRASEWRALCLFQVVSLLLFSRAHVACVSCARRGEARRCEQWPVLCSALVARLACGVLFSLINASRVCTSQAISPPPLVLASAISAPHPQAYASSRVASASESSPSRPDPIRSDPLPPLLPLRSSAPSCALRDLSAVRVRSIACTLFRPTRTRTPSGSLDASR